MHTSIVFEIALFDNMCSHMTCVNRTKTLIWQLFSSILYAISERGSNSKVLYYATVKVYIIRR